MDFLKEYIKKYDINDKDVNYKYYHSYRVMDNMELLAKNMSLPQYDIYLAKCIGLLHDIGRFEQTTKYHNYNDFIFDHGDYAEKILREDNILANFQLNKDDYEVVYKAVKYHNKFAIANNLTNREMLFAKMIRDADKLDILYAVGSNKMKKIFLQDDSEISDYLKNDFFNNKILSKREENTRSDRIIIMFGFIYDINFNITLEIIKENKYYEKIYNRLNDKEKYAPYLEHTKEYIDERTKKYVRKKI